MPPGSPRLPLVLLLLTAVCILAGGVVLSKREHTLRIPQDRAPLGRFALDLMRELRRLEDLHGTHLDELSRRVDPLNPPRTQRDCEAIVGVVECSFLTRGASKSEQYVRLPQVRYGTYPRPTFESPSFDRVDFILFDPARFFENADRSTGWVDEPGRPLFYWRQRSDKQVALLTIEPHDVQVAMNGWLNDWLRSHPPPATTAGAELDLLAPDDTPLVQGSVTRMDKEPPHWSQSLPTRYGTWNLASWDRTETRVTHHTPTLAIAAALAVIVALLGVFVFVQQRRAHRLATQRVSFVNRVSHELRTPLTNMLLNLDVVKDSLPEAEAEPASRLALVREEAGRLARLIENVLTFSRREQGTLKLHAVECRPREVVDGILAQFAPAFARRGITVTREHEGDDAPCLLASDALSQIAANLFSNVEKYAPNVPALVRTVQRDGRFSLAVSDEGPGIPASEQERIFEPFARVDDRVNAGVTGTGLGLSIARDLALRMGGKLRMVSAEKGACFVLEIPLVASLQAVNGQH